MAYYTINGFKNTEICIKMTNIPVSRNNYKKVLAFYKKLLYDLIAVGDTDKQTAEYNSYGSLVKRLRRRPLTAKTGVRFPYELLTV